MGGTRQCGSFHKAQGTQGIAGDWGGGRDRDKKQKDTHRQPYFRLAMCPSS